MGRSGHQQPQAANYERVILALHKPRVQCEMKIESVILDWIQAGQLDAPLALTPSVLGLGKRHSFEPMEVEILDSILMELFRFTFQSYQRPADAEQQTDWRVARNRRMGLDLYCRVGEHDEQVFYLLGIDE
jgi:hypothetical protein